MIFIDEGMDETLEPFYKWSHDPEDENNLPYEIMALEATLEACFGNLKRKVRRRRMDCRDCFS